MKKNKKKIIVTGCCGFVGSNFIERIVKNKNLIIYGIDNLSTGRKKFINQFIKKKNFFFFNKDLSKLKSIYPLFKNISEVYHFAANADVRNGFEDSSKDIKNNIIATYNILLSMKKHNVKKIFFSSTGSIYGETKVIPTPEKILIPEQTSIYGASKISCEALISAFCEGYKIQSWIFRFVSILGPNYTHGHVYDFYNNFINKKNKFRVLGNGNQKKSYLNVKDCISAILLAKKKLKQKINICNLGTEEYFTVKRSLKVITKYLEWKPRLTYSKTRRGWRGDIPFILLDISKMKKVGWKPKYSIEDSIIQTLDFFKKNSWVFKRKR